MNLTIDSEFKNLICPLTDDELRGLEESIKAEGCRNALICWDGILLDGHNRYEICQRLGIEPEIKNRNFSDREAAKVWIIANQLNRRNLSKYQKAKLVLTRDAIYKAQAKERERAGGGDHKSKEYKESGIHHGGYPIVNQGNRTDDRLAKEAGVSHKLIHEVRVIENEATEEAKQALAKGETTINNEYKKLREPKHRPSLTQKARINIIRELSGQGHRSEQISEKLGISKERIRFLARKSNIELPDELLNKRRSIDINRIISETVVQAQSLAAGLELVDSRINDVSASSIPEWIQTLSGAISALNGLIKKLRRRQMDECQNSGKIQAAG